MYKLITTILAVTLHVTVCNAEFRDPTQPAYSQPSMTENGTNFAEAENRLILTAIWISPKSRHALINGINVKEGQTIEIEQQTASLTAKPSADTTEPATKAPPGTATELMNPELLEKLTSIAPMQFAPLLQEATKPLDIPQLPAQNMPSGLQQADITQPAKAFHVPVRLTTIKIIRIDKNSVTIDQNGELRTLQLVQRSYNSAPNKYRVN